MLKNLKSLREKYAVTQQCLAVAVGVSQQSINKYENHNIEPDVCTLIAIADFFHTSVDYLIGHCEQTDETVIQTNLSDDEIKIVNYYRKLSLKEKESIHLIMENYIKKCRI